MATHKTTVGVDTARLLIIDPGYIGQIDWPDQLADLPKADPKKGFVKVGPAGLGLLVSPTGYGDGAYNAEVLTFKDPAGYTRVARVTVTFDAAQVGDNPVDLEVEARLAAQGFKGRLPDELRTDEARRLDDHEDHLNRLEAWVEGTVYFKPQGTVTGPPVFDDDPFVEKSIFEELPPFVGLPEDLAVALAGFVYDADLRLNTDNVEKVVTALGYLAPG